LEAQVGAGGFESFVERAIVGDGLTDPLFKSGVLGGDSLDDIACPFGFQVADLAEQFANAVALKQKSVWAVLSASSALRARSRQVDLRALSVSTASRCCWLPVCRMASATAVFASGLV